MTKKEAIKFLQQIYPNGGHCWLDEQRMEAINMAIDVLKSTEVSDDLEEAATVYAKKDSKGIENPANFYYVVADKSRIFKDGANWQLTKLMKDAVECDVLADKDGFYTTETWDEMNNLLHKINAKNGDKVYLVILKD